MLGIRWQDKITSLEILDTAETTSTEAMLPKAQLRGAGCVIRMEEHRVPRPLLYGELVSGKQSRGCPRKQFRDFLKENLKWVDIKPAQLKSAVMEQSSWCSLS